MIINNLSNAPTKYSLLNADPPWKQTRGGKKKAVRNTFKPFPYQVIGLEEIKEHLRQATALCEENSVLFLWTIEKYLFEAQQIAEELGWKLHARMVWNKVTGIPAAYTIRFGHEYLLYMWRGKFPPVAVAEQGKIHSVFTEKVKKHSQKPEAAFEIKKRLYPNAKKLELYARKERTGWDCWGNEVTSKANNESAKQD